MQLAQRVVTAQWDRFFPQAGVADSEPDVAIVRTPDWRTASIGSVPSGFTSQSFAQVEELGLLDLLYRFQDYQDVSSFLRSRPFLIELLLGAYTEIHRLFPGSSQLVLEVVRDPEGDPNGRLFLYVLAPVTGEEAYGLLQQLDDEWWLESATRSRCQMTIDVDYTACLIG